jgi:hypothetical protein
MFLLFLQVDVIDAEYERLCEEIESNRHSAYVGPDSGTDKRHPQNFKSVLQAHKNYLATVVRLSMVDNVIVQDAIERVLHACMRVVAVYHLLLEEDREQQGQGQEERHGDSNSSSGGTGSIPMQEVEALKKDFFTQMSYLLQIMRKVENRGFIFRVDFNGFMSEMASEVATGGQGSSVGAAGMR